jgi:hypothetical protein
MGYGDLGNAERWRALRLAGVYMIERLMREGQVAAESQPHHPTAGSTLIVHT